MAEHLYTYEDPPSEKHLEKACAILENGGVLAYPTDLNWAFGCDAGNVKALDRIRLLKPIHPKDQPFSLICSDISMASTVGNIDHQAYRLLKKAWPGPYTMIFQRNRTLARQIKDKRPVVGIRIPSSELVLALVAKFGRPLATTSIPLKPDGHHYAMGWEIFDDFGHGIDLLLDLGAELPGLESTVVDMTEGVPQVVRVGAGDPSIFG